MSSTIEPFEVIKHSQKIFNEDGTEVFNLSPSGATGCFWNYYRNKTPELKIEITETLNEIFKKGRETHMYEEIYNEGAKRLISFEQTIKAVHTSKRFTISGRYDAFETDVHGLFFRDFKRASNIGRFYHLLRDGVGFGYKMQKSMYAYLYSLESGVYINKGVLTTILVDETEKKRLRRIMQKIIDEKPLNQKDLDFLRKYFADYNYDKKYNIDDGRTRLSLSVNLFPVEVVRDFILTHPTLQCVLGEISTDELESKCVEYMKDKTWMCGNCQYKINDGDCYVRLGLE